MITKKIIFISQFTQFSILLNFNYKKKSYCKMSSQNQQNNKPQAFSNIKNNRMGSNSSSIGSVVPTVIRDKHTVKPLIFTALNLLSFIVQLNYSIQNALITMLMIAFQTPSMVDSFVWIIPNIITMIIRPYVIRFVHKAHKAHKMRSQANTINLFLFIGSIGSIVIAYSASINAGKKGFDAYRIFICTIGWVLTGLSFQLCCFFQGKFKQSLEQLCYIKIQSTNTNVQQSKNRQKLSITLINFQQIDASKTLLQNFAFLGAAIGYIMVIALYTFSFKNTGKMKSFFQQSNIVYNISAFLTFFSAILFYFLISFSNIPKPDPQIKPKSASLSISSSPNYYLPGLSELKYLSLRGIGILAVHFIMIFVMDVMFIYTTMWTAGSNQASDLKQSEMNFYGQKNGVFYLLLYTIVYYANLIPQFSANILTTFKMLLFFNSIILVLAFWYNYSLGYLVVILCLVWLFKNYQDQVMPYFQQIQPQVKISRQVVERIQKVAVLNVLPFVTMIILGRDDIQDCLIWCAVLLTLVGIGLFRWSQDSIKIQNTEQGVQGTFQNQQHSVQVVQEGVKVQGQGQQQKEKQQ